MRVLSSLLFIASLAVAGCNTNPKPAPGKPSPAPVSVNVHRAAERQFAQTLSVTGTVAPLQMSKVSAATPGIVASTHVETGDFVSAGAVLIRLDARESRLRIEQARAAQAQAEAAFRQARSRIGEPAGGSFDPLQTAEAQAARADLEAAEAEARLAEENYRRHEILIRNDNVTRMAFDEARAQVEKARAGVTAAKRRLESTLKSVRVEYNGVDSAGAGVAGARAALGMATKLDADLVVRAPFAGFVVERFANKGEYVSTDRPVVEIVSLESLKLQLRLSETDAAKIKIGAPVEAVSDAHPQNAFSGKVTAVNPVVDPAGRTLIIEAIVSNPERKLRPGMFVKAKIDQAATAPRIVVPKSAVFRHPTLNAFCLYAAENDHARLRVVRAGETTGDDVEILDGLKAGEMVVIGKTESLSDGAPISVAR